MKRVLFLLASMILSCSVFAQAPARHKVALLSPLFLDSAFDATNTYRFNTNFPKYLNPGLEFYLGAQAALDSLQKAGAPLDVYVVDTRSRRGLAQELKAPELQNTE